MKRITFYGTLVITALLALVITGNCQAQEVAPNDPRLQKLYDAEAKRWEMWVGADKKRRAEMVAEPVFRWQNMSRDNGQTGAMYVWVDGGRPVVIGGVFSNAIGSDKRYVMHEFHALGPDRLFPDLRQSKNQWRPDNGIAMPRLPDSPEVESTAARVTLQLRTIGRDFAANSVDDTKKRWELRLLPKPLYRYEKPQGNIVDGALIAFVSDAGTDPEIILMLEAREELGQKAWYYRAVRLSISDLYVDYKGQRVWSSLREELNASYSNKDKTYFLCRDLAPDELPNPILK